MNSYKWVTEYIEHLSSHYGLQVSIRDFCGFMSKNSEVANSLLPYCIHSSPFCMCVKEDRTMQDRCTAQGRYLLKKCSAHNAPFLTICYCGYTDLVIPVKFNGTAVAAVCVGGLEASREKACKRITTQSRRYGRNRETLLVQYEKSLTALADLNTVRKSCSVIADFLLMYYAMLHSNGLVQEAPQYLDAPATLYLLNNIDHFIHTHYSSDIHVQDIADYCKCSRSYISHIFKKNMNRSIPVYINEVRISQAKRMLLHENSITKVCEACGFSNPSYFSSVFGKCVGMSPSQYRATLCETQLPEK